MTTTAQRLTAITTLALLALAPAVSAGAAAEKKPKPVTVGIFDNYYEPAKLKVAKGTTIVWKWPAVTGDSHDVTLDSGPKGVKKFQSPVAAAQFKYKRTLDKPGKYHILCTLHEEMTMDIVVRR
ncbi:MAG TPA: plastocyanin/azurin family copper-binding protein [Capillimicrobium sp.]|jgi:plastocyanin